MLESIAPGWGLALLAAFAWWSGMTFLVGGTLGGGLFGEVAQSSAGAATRAWPGAACKFASAALALVGALVAARRWPLLRHPALAAAAAVLIALAALMPSLGATLLMLALLATSSRLRLAAAATVAAAWIVGAFTTSSPGRWRTRPPCSPARARCWACWRGGWQARERKPRRQPRVPVRRASRAPASPSACSPCCSWPTSASATKETLIRDGRPVFVELAPVDPRSLMQGDFMRLNFNVPASLPSSVAACCACSARARWHSSTSAAWRACAHRQRRAAAAGRAAHRAHAQAGTLDPWSAMPGSSPRARRSAGRVRATASSRRCARPCAARRPARAGSASPLSPRPGNAA